MPPPLSPRDMALAPDSVPGRSKRCQVRPTAAFDAAGQKRFVIWHNRQESQKRV